MVYDSDVLFKVLLSGTKIIAEFSIYALYGYAGEAIAFSAFVMLVYENGYGDITRLKKHLF